LNHAISPSSGNLSSIQTLVLTGGNTVLSQETAAGLFSVAGGTGSSIGTPTITSNIAGTVIARSKDEEMLDHKPGSIDTNKRERR
jgi:hypothetical protein